MEMKTLVQRYCGLNEQNCELWLDTAWATVKEASSAYPVGVYREARVQVVRKHTVWADHYTTQLKPCCEAHRD